jgi:hypothetical protein
MKLAWRLENERIILTHFSALTAEEPDFIVNYDIKYRLGGSDEDGDDE